MSFNFGEESYTHYPDEREYTAKDFFDRLRNGDMSTTNQINQAEFTDVFESYLQNGVDVLYIGFSSALSGTYHNSVMVAEELCKKYPEQALLVADSLTATLGTGLLVYAAVQKQREGMTIQELYQWVQNERLLVSGWFTVDDLHFLKRGGRISAATAVLDKKVLLILSLCKGLSVTIPVAEAPAIQTVRQLAEALYERVNL